MSALLAFVASIPDGWATCPVYAKGAKLPKGGEACGKSPLGRASYDNLSPAATALYIEREPEVFQAVGVYAGPRSNGLVIFDVDANLGAVEKKWGKDLAKAPKITSPKKNAAKFLFRIPEEFWGEVQGMSLAASQEGWEVLWGRQGVLCGAYPKGGEYSFKGDLNAVPEAPGWLLARMQDSFRSKHDKADKKALKDSRWGMRSREEKIAVAQSCLSVIPPQGRGSEDFWWRIGAMLNSELPGEDGLNLWREWSLQDSEYADDWTAGHDPCGDRWEAGFKTGGGLGFGSLVHQADHYDPDRARFQKDGIAHVIDAVQTAPVKYAQEYVGGQELLDRAIAIEEEIEDPALLDQAKNLLAHEAGRREGAIAIDRLLDQHITFKRSKGGKPADVSQLDDSGFDYLVPGLIPKPWLLLVHADGGTGKSAMAMTLCKHLVQGRPFNVHGKMFDVPVGKALWLNGDQSERITRRQFNLIGVETAVDVVGEWDMAWYRRFCRMQGGGMDADGNITPGKYDLIVIDSLDGCNDSNPYEENRREYAYPLKRLARRNGQDFGACTVLVIHHNSKAGGFRGTSAIKAAVDETWNMNKLEGAELAKLGLPANTRMITVEKSRDDREGQQMLFTLQSDYTYKISALEGTNVVRGAGPNNYMLDVLDAMAEDTNKAWSAADIEAHPSLGGVNRKRAIRYALKRLEEQQLIARCAPPKDRSFNSRPPTFFKALSTKAPVAFSKRSLTRGDIKNDVSKEVNPVPSTDSADKGVCQKVPFVKRVEEVSKPTGPFDKDDLLTKPLSIQNPSSATEEPFCHDSEVIGMSSEEAKLKAIWDKAHKMWD